MRAKNYTLQKSFGTFTNLVNLDACSVLFPRTSENCDKKVNFENCTGKSLKYSLYLEF